MHSQRPHESAQSHLQLHTAQNDMYYQQNQGVKEMPEVRNSFTQFAFKALPIPVWLVQKVACKDLVKVLAARDKK